MITMQSFDIPTQVCRHILVPDISDDLVDLSLRGWKDVFDAEICTISRFRKFSGLELAGWIILPLITPVTNLACSIVVGQISQCMIVVVVDQFSVDSEVRELAQIVACLSSPIDIHFICTKFDYVQLLKSILPCFPILCPSPIRDTRSFVSSLSTRDQVYILASKHVLLRLIFRCSLRHLKIVISFLIRHKFNIRFVDDAASFSSLSETPEYFVRLGASGELEFACAALAAQGAIPLGPVECNVIRSCSPYGVCSGLGDSISRLLWLSNVPEIRRFAGEWAKLRSLCFDPFVVRNRIFHRSPSIAVRLSLHSNHRSDAGFLHENLRLVRSSAQDGCSTGVLKLVCMVKDSQPLISKFLGHYRKLGVKEFIFIDNGSSDGTLEQLSLQSDVTLYQTLLEHWKYQNDVRSFIIDRHCFRSWFFCVDADELFVYPKMERFGMDELLEFLQWEGATAVCAYMIDLLPRHRNVLRVEKLDELSYFEPSSMIRRRYFQDFYSDSCFNRLLDPDLPSKIGGPRQALLPKDANSVVSITKHPLMFLDSVIEPLAGGHFCNHAVISSLACTLLHYKFFNGFSKKFERLKEKQAYTAAEKEHIEAYSKLLGAGTIEGGDLKYFDTSDSFIEHEVFHRPDLFIQWAELRANVSPPDCKEVVQSVSG